MLHDFIFLYNNYLHIYYKNNLIHVIDINNYYNIVTLDQITPEIIKKKYNYILIITIFE
jgi:hypothetical protein